MKPAKHPSTKKSRLPWVPLKGTATRPSGVIYSGPSRLDESRELLQGHKNTLPVGETLTVPLRSASPQTTGSMSEDHSVIHVSEGQHSLSLARSRELVLSLY